MNYPRYYVTVYTWNAKTQEHEPIIYDFKTWEEAKAFYDKQSATDDTPQIDLYHQTKTSTYHVGRKD